MIWGRESIGNFIAISLNKTKKFLIPDKLLSNFYQIRLHQVKQCYSIDYKSMNLYKSKNST